ncbi:MAG TPA: hypothetical protein VE397_06410 [Stellaceae bacterium]|nr:hypothetical protein [Stellaceae bacterium]
MKHRWIIAGVVAPLAVAATAFAAGPAPFVGEWHWDKARSVSPPGEPQPRAVVLTITSADAAHVAWRLAMTGDNGEQHQQSFNGTGDGKPVAVAGSTGGATAAFIVTATTLDSIYSYPDGASDKSSCALSADARTMTCHGTENDGKGHAAAYADVYDRH